MTKAVKKDIECTKTFKPKQPHPNLDKGEREAIKELSKRKDVIITNADKGGAVVIVDTNDYIKKAERQLNDKDKKKNKSNIRGDTSTNSSTSILTQDPTLV